MTKIKVLQTVNVVPTNVAAAMGKTTTIFGGWVESMAARLKDFPEIVLAVACKCENQSFDLTVDGVNYHSLDYSENRLRERLAEIIELEKPDIIHIEGTEFPHARAAQLLAKEKNIPCVVSLQGILNGNVQYQCGLLPMEDLLFSRSISDIYVSNLLRLRKQKWFAKRLAPEREIISDAKYLLGRTSWDRAHSYALNKDAKYYTCARILRDPFYTEKWSPEKTERHSVYVGNGYMPLKGVHFMIEAMPELLREYPDFKLYVAGHKPFEESDKRPFFKKGYGLYLEKLINRLGVSEHIEFTGPLSADKVAKKLATVNAYVLCSTIENSPNTLGEAMLVGTPCVSAYAGGASDMAKDGEEALFYRCNDPALLAWQLKRIFDSDDLAKSLSEKAQKHAAVTHDGGKNALALVECYKDILKTEGK